MRNSSVLEQMRPYWRAWKRGDSIDSGGILAELTPGKVKYIQELFEVIEHGYFNDVTILVLEYPFTSMAGIREMYKDMTGSSINEGAVKMRVTRDRAKFNKDFGDSFFVDLMYAKDFESKYQDSLDKVKFSEITLEDVTVLNIPKVTDVEPARMCDERFNAISRMIEVYSAKRVKEISDNIQPSEIAYLKILLSKENLQDGDKERANILRSIV